MRGSMAIDPQEIAEENTQRSALAQKAHPRSLPKIQSYLRN